MNGRRGTYIDAASAPKRTLEDLQPWTRSTFERAWRARERPQCSRDDFAAGYLAALVAYRVWSAFHPTGLARWVGADAGEAS